MRFCNKCNGVMRRHFENNFIKFRCRCENVEYGGASDTLIAEGTTTFVENDAKHQIFIENSPFDPARQIVLKQCPQCALDFMTLISIGSNERMIFTCSCGARVMAE